jgi:hypothetical protein
MVYACSNLKENISECVPYNFIYVSYLLIVATNVAAAQFSLYNLLLSKCYLN